MSRLPNQLLPGHGLKAVALAVACNLALVLPAAADAADQLATAPDAMVSLADGTRVPAWERDLVQRLQRLQQLASVDRGVRKTVSAARMRQQQIDRARREAVLRQRRGDVVGAMLTVARGLRANPDSAELVVLQARLLLVDGQAQAALDSLTNASLVTAKASQRLQGELLALQGVAALAAGRWRVALDSYRHLLALAPTEARWWVGLAVSLNNTGQIAAAQRAWGNAELVATGNPALQQLARSQAGAAATQLAAMAAQRQES